MKKLILISLSLFLLLGCKEDRPFVISKIKSTAKLATTETIIDKVIVGSKQRRILGLIKAGEADFVAYTQATVKTGVDLTKLHPDDVKIEGQAIELTLPHIEVLDFAYPFDSFKVDKDISRNAFLTKIDVLDQEEFYRRGEMDIRNNLDKMGLIEQTQQNVRQMMEGMLKNLGYEEIYIFFKEGELIPKIDLRGESELADEEEGGKKE